MKFTFQLRSIVHDGSVVIPNLQIIATSAILPLITFVKVVNPLFRNVVPLNGHILVSVSPGMLMEES